jgi:SAM-dependent methyltransferase
LAEPGPIEFTGERLVPGQVDQDLLNEHLARYAFACRLARHKRVLDIACGMGYGSAALAALAAQVVGLDVSAEAAAQAHATYRAENLRFLAAPAQAIPFRDASFDLIVAFEVIEHLQDWPALLAEAHRLLAPGGQFIVSTPNKDFYAESRRLDGPNPYHVHEFEYEEFRDALSRVFPSVALFVQNHVGAIAFHPVAGAPAPVAELAAGHEPPAPAESHFFLAVCALTPQTGSPFYLYLPTAANVLRERERHVLKLEAELRQKDLWLEELKEQQTKLYALHMAHQDELAAHIAWARSLEQDLSTANARVVALQDELAGHQQKAAQTVAAYEAKISELDAELIDRTQRAAALVAVHEQLEAEMKAKLEELAKCVDLLHAAEKLVEERTLWAQQLDARVRQLEQTLTGVQDSRWIRFGRKFGIGPDLQNF